MERSDVPLSLRKLVFFSFLTATLFFNVDRGVFAPALLVIEHDLEINDKQIAVLSGITFMVCGSLTILTAPAMIRFEARSVIIFCAICNSLGLFIFISFHNYYMIVVGRALSGISQAGICAYAPVWINEFAPLASAT